MNLTEQQEKEFGEWLVSLFQKKKIRGSVDRYALGEGHSDKTKLGIARTVLGRVREIESQNK